MIGGRVVELSDPEPRPFEATDDGRPEGQPGLLGWWPGVLRRFGVGTALGLLLAAIGGLMVIVGYFQVSAASQVKDQLSFLSSASVGGVALLLTAVLLVGIQHVVELRRLTSDQPIVPPAASQPAPVVRPGSGAPLVRLPGSSAYHRPDCIFVVGKGEVEPLVPTDRGLRPCEVCEP